MPPYFMEWSFTLEQEVGQEYESAGAIRWNKSSESTLFDTSERLPNCMPGMLRPVSL